jgi:poly(3-hydroxybutyrate) depolymerase
MIHHSAFIAGKILRAALPLLGLTAASITLSGCAVPQPPGKGQLNRLKEPTTGRGYWLYLPEDYVAQNGRRPDGRKWPLVMTFHGMKPYDNSKPQAREWEEEADRYGYVVCAPDLIVCDSLLPFPVHSGSLLDKDEQAILAIMDDVFRKTDADPSQVLSTSWSSGGFVAHYMVNRHPDRFSCLSTRQSNFNGEIMDPNRFARYRNMPIGLYYTTNDFGVCKRDTLRAIAWYKEFSATRLEAGQVQAFGHERTPEVAADFFARVCGATPKTPPTKLARIRIDEVPLEALAKAAPSNGVPTKPVPRAHRTDITNYSDSSLFTASQRADQSRSRNTNGSSGILFNRNARNTAGPESDRNSPYGPTSLRQENLNRRGRSEPAAGRTGDADPSGSRALTNGDGPSGATGGMPPQTNGDPSSFHEYRRPVYIPPARTPNRPTPRRQTPRRQAARNARIPMSVEVSANLGIAPLLIDYAVKLPTEHERGADFLWFDNDMPIGNGPSGQKVLTQAGEHRISVLVVTKEDRELRASTNVTVLAPITHDAEKSP